MENPPNPQNSKFLEDLQKASEEIEVGFQRKKPISRPDSSPLKEQVPEKAKTDLAEVKVEDEILARDWLKEITNERQKLEQAYKEAENLRRKIQQRLDRMRNLETNFSKVKNELAHFPQIKKENQAFLEEIKNMLKNQNEPR